MFKSSESLSMLSDMKRSGEPRSRDSSRERTPSPGLKLSSSEGKKSSLFTVDSLLAPHHHRDTVQDIGELSPPATPPSPPILKPLAMPNNHPLFLLIRFHTLETYFSLDFHSHIRPLSTHGQVSSSHRRVIIWMTTPQVSTFFHPSISSIIILIQSAW